MMTRGQLKKILAGCVLAGLGVGRADGDVVTNGDFNADSYSNFPGYAGGTGGTITGWSYTGSVGLNPAAGSPFAPQNFNTAPSTYAFLQTTTGGPTATLSQTLTNLNPGQSYEVSYQQGPRASDVGDSTLTGSIGAFSSTNTNVASSFQTIAGQFVATGPTMTVTFTNVLNASVNNDGTNDVTSVSISPLNGPTVVNGNFETAASDFTSDYGYVSGSPSASNSQNPAEVAGFVGTGGGNFGINGPKGAFSGTTNNNTNVLFIQTSGTALTQTIYNFIPGDQYKLDFQYDSRDPSSIGGPNGGDPGIDVSIDGVSYVVSDVAYSSGDYYNGEIDFTASGSSETLSIGKTGGPNPADDSTALFDNFSISVVPEPASATLFVAAAGSLLIRRRRNHAN